MTTLTLPTTAPAAAKLKTFAYWGATALTAFAFLTGGIADLTRGPAMVSAMAHLGYPSYFMLILGAWKVLGALAIVAPRLPRLKEWAYAGMAFDLTGAALSHAAVGDPAAKVLVPLVILGIAAASWALRPVPSRRLSSAEPLPAHA
jgi:hypothetical protein